MVEQHVRCHSGRAACVMVVEQHVRCHGGRAAWGPSGTLRASGNGHVPEYRRGTEGVRRQEIAAAWITGIEDTLCCGFTI